MAKNNIMIHCIKKEKSVSFQGIYCDDDGYLYIEKDGIEMPLSSILKDFRDEVVRISVTSEEEVMM